MPQAVQLPNGSWFPLREGEDPRDALTEAAKLYPEAFGIKKKEEGVKRDTTGFKAAASASTSRLQGEAALTAAKMGLMDPDKAEAYYKAKEEEAKARFTPTEQGWTEAPFQKFKETLGGSVPYMAAPAAAGIAALAAPVSVPAAAALGAAGAGLTSAAQFTGTNIARQMDTGKSLAETSGAAAFGAAIPQALLDTAAMALLPGIGKLFGSVGTKLTTEQARAIASQTLGRTVADYAAKTGTAMGREGITEATQQALERLQAGLSITDPEARKEYIDSFIGGAALAGAGAPIGRAFERGSAKEQAAKADKEEKDKARQAALMQQEQDRAAEKQRLADEAAAAEAERNSPDYALRIAQEYKDLEQKQADLQEQVRRGTKDKPLSAEDKAFNETISAQLKENGAALKKAAVEKTRVTQSGLLAQAEQEQRREKLSPMEYMLEQTPEVTESKFTPVAEDTSGYAMPEPVVPSAAPSQRQVLQNYATKSVELANDNLLSNEKAPADAREDYAQYLMQDFPKALALVQTKPNIPNLTAKQNTDLYKRLTQLVGVEQQKIAAGTATAQQRLSALEEQEQMTMEEQRLEEAKARARATQEALQAKGAIEEARTQMRIAPEIEAVRRLGKLPEDSFAAANAEYARKEVEKLQADKEMAQRLVETLPVEPRKQPPGRVQAGLAAPKARRSELLAKLEIARATRNDEAVRELRDALDDLDQAEEVTGRGELNLDPATIKALSGVEAPVMVDKQVDIGNAVDAQNAALVKAVRSLEDSRRVGQNILPPAFYQRLKNARQVLNERLRDPKSSKEARAAAQKTYDDLKKAFTLQRRGQTQLVIPAELQARIDQARRDYVDAHISELAAQYESYGLPAPADWERGEARARVMDAFNELESRWDVFGAPMQAVDVLQDQMRQNITTSVANAVKRQTKATEEKLPPKKERTVRVGAKELKLRGEEKPKANDKEAALELIERLLATLPTRTRAVATGLTKPEAKVKNLADIAKLFKEDKEQIVSEKTSPEVVEFLTRARDALEVSSNPELALLVREEAQRVMNGSLPDPFAVREIDDLIKMQKAAGVSETPPGATPEELQRTSAQVQEVLFPEAEVAVTRATPKNFQRLLDSKDIQGLRQAIAQQKQENIDVLKAVQERLPGSQKSITNAELRTRQALERAKELGKGAASVTEEVQKEWGAAARDVVAAETAVQSIPRRIAYLKDIQTSLEGLTKQGKATLMEMVNEALNFVNNRDNPTALRDSLEAKEFSELKQWLDPAKTAAEIKKLNALYKQASKALEPARQRLQAALQKYDQDATIRESLEREHTKAQQAVERAQAEERQAKAAGAVEEQQAKEARARAIEAERAYNAALTRAQAGMGLPGRRVEVDTAALRKEEAKIRRAMGSLRDQVESAKTDEERVVAQEKYTAKEQELEQLYEKAPRKETALKEPGEEMVGKAFADVQAAKEAGIAARRRKREGEGAPALPTRMQGQLMRQGNTQKVVQTGVKRMNRAVEIAGQLLEKRAVTQAELKEVQDRMQRLRDAGKDKENRRFTPLFKKLQEEEARLKARVNRIDELHRRAIAAQGGKQFVNVYEERETGNAPVAVKAPRTFAVKTPANRQKAAMSRLERSASAQRDTSYEFDGLTYKDVAQRMADTSPSEKDRAFFERLVEVFEVFPVEPVSGRVYGSSISMGNTGEARGVFVPNKNEEAIFIKTGLTEADNRHVLMHELAHAASVYALKTNPELAEQVTKLREKVEAWAYSDEGDAFMYANFKPRTLDGMDFFGELYGLTNDAEFIAEAFSREGFQKILAEIPSDKPKLSIFSRLVGYLAKALGLSGKAAQSSLAEALSLTEKLFNRTRNEIYAQETVDRGGVGVSEYNPSALTDLADRIVAKPKTIGEQLKDIKTLELEMSGVDSRAALEEVLKRGAAAMGDDTKYKQAMYLVRKRDDLLSQARAVMDTGAPETFRDEKGFLGVRTSGKDSAVPVFEAMSKVPVDNPREKVAITSAYLIARRATNKGLEKLDVGGLGIDQADLDAAMAAANADPALKAALEEVARRYNAYNRGLIEFNVETGAIPKALGKELLANGDYIPFYRVKNNGVAELVFSDKMVFTVGDIRNQPYLAELKGGEDKIMPLDQSIMRNTLLLVDKGLTNLAERNVAYALQDIGKGKGPIDPDTGKPKNLMAIHTGDGPDDARVIRFNQEPDPANPKDDGKRWLKVESEGTAIEGVPAELVVKSLEGASLPLPGILKLAGVASDILRTGITRTPLYIARQLYKEPMAATFTGGLNYTPFRAVLEAGKEYVRMMRGTSETQAKLIEKGLVQSQIFSGSPNDISKIALQLARGGDQSVINKVFGALDRAATNADAATRALVYDNARKNGLSEVEAEHMAREYMNFSKRGSNAGVQYASRLIPFLNSQIQGLNVLIKAFRGNMPFEEQLRIKRKFYNNAALLFATGIVYAMAMEDDEYFKNARPRDKYTNFFLHLPGVEEPIKIATPFEAGYFFSLAVAAVDGMKRETNNAEQFAALRDMFLQSIPGYSSMGMPQIIKPAFEVWTNKNFFTGAPIESLRLKNMDITERYTESTTEMAKAMSKAVPILSPIQIEHIVRGYLGIAPLAAAAMANSLMPTPERGERPATRASDLPLIGSAFQRKMGGAQADEVYDLAEAAFQARTTFNTMVKEGRREEAKTYREENKVELASAIDAGQYRQLVGRLNSDIRRTQSRTDLTGDEKRARIDRLEDAKLKAAKDFLTRYRAREERLGD